MPAPGTHPGSRPREGAACGTPARRDAAPGEGESGGSAPRSLRSFLRETRGAVGYTAAALAIMFLGGIALVSDHLWMIGKRDLLQRAADAAAIATTFELRRRPSSESDAQVEAALEPLAERYARFNVLGNTDGEIKPEDIEVTLDVDRAAGTVGVSVKADVLDTLFAKWLYGYEGPGEVTTRAGRGARHHQGRGGARAGCDQVDDLEPREQDAQRGQALADGDRSPGRPHAGRHPRSGGRGVHGRDRGGALAHQRASERDDAHRLGAERVGRVPEIEDVSVALRCLGASRSAARDLDDAAGSRSAGWDASISAHSRGTDPPGSAPPFLRGSPSRWPSSP